MNKNLTVDNIRNILESIAPEVICHKIEIGDENIIIFMAVPVTPDIYMQIVCETSINITETALKYKIYENIKLAKNQYEVGNNEDWLKNILNS